MRDATGFDDFYRATAASTLRYANAVIIDRGEAQDAVQEAYARAWRRWRTVSAHPAPEAWVRVVVARLATDRWRRMARTRSAMAKAGGVPMARPPSENTVLLVSALRKLPFAHRRALALHYLCDLSVEQIAVETGASVGTVKSWLSRGRTRMAEILEPVEAPDAR